MADEKVTLEFLGRQIERILEDQTVTIGMLRQMSARLEAVEARFASIDEQLAGMRHQFDGLTRKETRLDRLYEDVRKRLDELAP